MPAHRLPAVWRGSTQPAAIEQRDPHLHHLNRGKLVEYRRRRQTRRVDHQPVLQRHLQAVSKECDEHMGIGAMFELMIDRSNSQFRLQRSKHALDLRQLHITRPQHRRIFAGEIAAQQIVPIPLLGRLELRLVGVKRERRARDLLVLLRKLNRNSSGALVDFAGQIERNRLTYGG